MQNTRDIAAPIIILLLYTGLRIGEALALTWDDIDFNESLIRKWFQQ